MKNPLLFLAGVGLLFPACGGDTHKKGETFVRYTSQPLKEFQDPVTDLPTGTTVNILGFAGGDLTKKDSALYYCQFIVLNKMTGDTVRVLAAVINVEGAGSDGGPVLSPATMYSGDKGVRDATFLVPDSNQKMIIDMMPDIQGGEPDTAKMLSDVKTSGAGGTKVSEFVLIPDGVPFFVRHYKTAAGILSFKQQPW